jgi:hypothetical protein
MVPTKMLPVHPPVHPDGHLGPAAIQIIRTILPLIAGRA